MSRAIIALNAGSSSIKFGLYLLAEGGPQRAATGVLEAIGIAPRLMVRDTGGVPIAARDWPDGAALTHEALLEDLYRWADGHLPHHDIVAVGHRVVHGGAAFCAPARVTADLLAELEALCPLAPLHQPHNLAAIRAIAALAPGLPQIACFDTAFHRTMPEDATRLPLPAHLHDRGVRRYGFHGLSYDHVARRLRLLDPKLADGRVIAAHLGNGASLCAMAGGSSIDTTMGFTALDGLVMGTRTGSIDPGVLLYLMQEDGMRAREVESLLYRQSGLLGLSGVSSDMRALHASDDPRARTAIALFVRAVLRNAGGLVAMLGGLDGIVFTAGIGENDAVIRKQVCDGLGWLGVMLDDAANAAGAPCISRADSRVTVRIVPTDEEGMIARYTHALTAGAAA